MLDHVDADAEPDFSIDKREQPPSPSQRPEMFLLECVGNPLYFCAMSINIHTLP